jgi:hypothetical protein
LSNFEGAEGSGIVAVVFRLVDQGRWYHLWRSETRSCVSSVSQRRGLQVRAQLRTSRWGWADRWANSRLVRYSSWAR